MSIIYDVLSEPSHTLYTLNDYVKLTVTTFQNFLQQVMKFLTHSLRKKCLCLTTKMLLNLLMTI